MLLLILIIIFLLAVIFLLGKEKRAERKRADALFKDLQIARESLRGIAAVAAGQPKSSLTDLILKSAWEGLGMKVPSNADQD